MQGSVAGAIEAPEDVRQIRRVNSGPVVADRSDPLPAIRFQSQGDQAAFGRKFQSVVEQDQKQAAQRGTVSLDGNPLGRQAGFGPDATGGCQCPYFVHHFFHEKAKVNCFQRHFHHARIAPRQKKQVLHQLRHALRLGTDFREGIAVSLRVAGAA